MQKINWGDENYLSSPDGEMDEDFEDDDPCLRCDPSCEYWLADNLCQLELDRQKQVEDAFLEKFVSHIHCIVCGKEVQQISLPTSRLWVWPGGNWEFAGEAMLGLRFFGTLYSEKKILHTWEEADARFYHVWTMERSHDFILRLRKKREDRGIDDGIPD